MLQRQGWVSQVCGWMYCQGRLPMQTRLHTQQACAVVLLRCAVACAAPVLLLGCHSYLQLRHQLQALCHLLVNLQGVGRVQQEGSGSNSSNIARSINGIDVAMLILNCNMLARTLRNISPPADSVPATF